MKLSAKSPLIQFMKYIVVGVMNTTITLAIIFICKSLLGVNEYVSNAIGYVAGLINSFLWNRTWVFHSTGNGFNRQAVIFLAGFCFSYAIQLAVVWIINQSWFGDMEFELIGGFVISGYGIATLVGAVCYTVSNFVFNRLITFKESKTTK